MLPLRESSCLVDSLHDPLTTPAIQIHLHRLTATAEKHPGQIPVRTFIDDLVLRPGRHKCEVPGAQLKAAWLFLS